MKRTTTRISASAIIRFVLVALFTVITPSVAMAEDVLPFNEWLAGVRKDALAEGISEKTVAAALTDLQPEPKIIALDRRQAEFSQSFTQYKTRVVNPQRIATGKALLKQHKALLDKVAATYNVQPRFIVALWAIETDFGRFTGGHSVIQALATLAHDGRRAEFFRKELMNALKIVDQGHISLSRFTGSWAGAMGQSQFMPSSFLSYAVDFDGDGKKDIWQSLPDIFGSIANYLKSHGWDNARTWGRPVRLPENFDVTLASLDSMKPLPEWQELGIRSADGSALPRIKINAAVVIPDAPADAKATSPAFIVYENYMVIRKWNRSNLFALSVGALADTLR